MPFSGSYYHGAYKIHSKYKINIALLETSTTATVGTTTSNPQPTVDADWTTMWPGLDSTPFIDAQLFSTAADFPEFTDDFPAATNPPPINCPKYDFVFLPQNSNSVRWDKFKEFMSYFSRKLWLHPEASRVAVVPFGRKASTEDIIDFDDYSTKNDLLEKIKLSEKKKVRGHFVEKGLKHITVDMNVMGSFRRDAQLIVMLIMSSKSRSDDDEIRDAITGLGRMSNSVSGVKVFILHSSEVPELQLDALQHQQGFQRLEHVKFDVGPREGFNPPALHGMNRTLAKSIIEDLAACVDPDIIDDVQTTVFPVEPFAQTTDFPPFDATTFEPPMFTTFPDFPDPGTEFSTLLTTMATLMESTTEPLFFPPPPPPIGPPPLPARLQKVLIDTVIEQPEDGSTTKPASMSSKSLIHSSQNKIKTNSRHIENYKMLTAVRFYGMLTKIYHLSELFIVREMHFVS